MARVIKQIKDFSQGMTPNIYGEGIYRAEHYDPVTPQVRPLKALVASTMTADSIAMKDLAKFTRGTGNVLYAIGKEVTTNYAAFASWDVSNFRWAGFKSVGGGMGVFAEVILFYNGSLYGLRAGTHLWKLTTGGTLSYTHQARAYTNYCDPIIHSKDGLSYWATDNIVSSFDGTTLTVGLTLPTNFIITSIAEHGDYIMIVGYDSQTTKGISYLWDRDSSLATLTQKYELGLETPYHNASLGGTHFVITTDNGTSNTPTAYNKTKLIIRYLSGDQLKIHRQYLFSGIILRQSAHYVRGDRIYFNADVKFLGESSFHFVVFQLDEKGQLSIAQNVAVNDAGSVSDGLPGLIKDGNGFWIAGRTDGSWHTTTTYPSVSAQSTIIETTKYAAKDITDSLDVVGFTVNFEPLPSGASVVVKTRANEETSWTTVATFDTDNAVRGSMNGRGIATAKERQFRLESLGGTVITAWQCTLEEIKSENYG